jgi:maltooligosyltrehalose synthase
MMLGTDWSDTTVELPFPSATQTRYRWANRLTGRAVEGRRIALNDLLRDFPVALLTREAI